MARAAVLGVLVVALGLCAPARALDIEIEYDAPAAKQPLGMAVAVTFEDARPEDDGGGDSRSLGEMKTSRTFYVESDKGTVPEIFTGWVVQGLRAAGYDARAGNDPSLPRVHLVLEELMAYGFTHFQVPIKSKLQVIPAGSSAPVWEQRLESEGGVTLMWGPSEIVRGYVEAFENGFPIMAGLFGSAEFRAALGSGSSAAPATTTVAVAPPPAATTPPAVTTPPAETAPPVATAPPPPPAAEPRRDGISIPHIDESTATAATRQLRNFCSESFTVTFVFFAEDDEDEWTLRLRDEDRDQVAYVNLDNEDTIEFDGDDEDCDCDAEEDHEVRIRYRKEEIKVFVDGDEILEEDVDADDECVGLTIEMDEGMFIREFELYVD